MNSASGSVVEARGGWVPAAAVRPLGLAGLELRQPGEGLLRPLDPLVGRPRSGGGDPARRGRRIVVELDPQGGHLGLGRGERGGQGIGLAIRVAARRGSDPDAVLGDPGERDEPVRDERRNALGEEPVEQIAVVDPEVGQRVVVDADAAADPAVRVVLGAQPIERPSRADTLERRVQPVRGQDRRIDRRPARLALGRPDPLVHRPEIEALDERPHQARPVVGRQKALEIDRAQLELLAHRALDAGPTPPSRLTRPVIGGRDIEQLMHDLDRSWDDPAWESLCRKIHNLETHVPPLPVPSVTTNRVTSTSRPNNARDGAGQASVMLVGYV